MRKKMCKEGPIIFSDGMVRAILDGHKTQTRRTVQPGNTLIDGKRWSSARFAELDLSSPAVSRLTARQHCSLHVPRRIRNGTMCKVDSAIHAGMHLWVRESWLVEADIYRVKRDLTENFPRSRFGPYYRADASAVERDRKWRPAVHLPRWASRITLQITKARVERLHDITPEDCAAEGVASQQSRKSDQFIDTDPALLREKYKSHWEQINGTGAWDWNPWVWVFEFERLDP